MACARDAHSVARGVGCWRLKRGAPPASWVTGTTFATHGDAFRGRARHRYAFRLAVEGPDDAKRRTGERPVRRLRHAATLSAHRRGNRSAVRPATHQQDGTNGGPAFPFDALQRRARQQRLPNLGTHRRGTAKHVGARDRRLTPRTDGHRLRIVVAALVVCK